MDRLDALDLMAYAHKIHSDADGIFSGRQRVAAVVRQAALKIEEAVPEQYRTEFQVGMKA